MVLPLLQALRKSYRTVLASLLLVALVAEQTFAIPAPPRYPGRYTVPDAASSYAPKIDHLFSMIFWITLFFFVLVHILLIYFLIRYRNRGEKKARYSHGSMRLESLWTIIPTVILLYILFTSNSLWSEIKDPNNFPKNATVIRVNPRQFQWNIQYAGPDGQFDTPDDLNTINQLYLVKDQPVKIELKSQDVIHSFFVPEFRIKQDAVPGLPTQVWITPTKFGEYEIGCAELCGMGHYSMKGTVHVVTADSVTHWIASQRPLP